MPPRRTRAPGRPVSLSLDGKRIDADAEASLATALVAAGEWLLARSPKFHRPRGPSCFRGGCDGCLMRVDGAPNVMTCQRPATEGAVLERQNVILSSKLDVLRATDWFFAKGMNHHEMFAGVPGLQSVMLHFARRISGLGELPEQPTAPRSQLPVVEADALVVGGGLAGLLAAAALAEAGLRVLLCDDQPALGGALACLPPSARLGEHDADALLAAAIDGVRRGGVHVRSETTALGVLEGDDWLLAHPRDGLCRVRARAHVVATGGHDATPLFSGNDVPGVLSARAAGRLLRDGVLCGERIVIDVVGAGGVAPSPHGLAFARAARAEGAEVELLEGLRVASVRGLGQVRSVVLEDERGNASHRDCDAVVFDGPVAPCFEVAVQAGAAVKHGREGYRVEVDEDGRACADVEPKDTVGRVRTPRLRALGEVTGAPLEPDSLRAAAARLAASLCEELSR